jgi:hypothetical protein
LDGGFTPFSFLDPTSAVHGINTLGFEVQNFPQPSGNNGNPAGIQIDSLSGIALGANSPPLIPLPKSIWGGLGLIGAIGVISLLKKQSRSVFA